MVKRRRVKAKFHGKFDKAINQLRRMSPGKRRAAMSVANNSFIRQLSSRVRRLRHSKVSPKKVKRIRHYSHPLQQLANNKVSFASKRKILSQRGGFLPFLLPLLGPIVGLVSKIFK